MPNELGAMLVAEIGSVSTRVTLIDTVDGEERLISQADVPSTIEPPHENAVAAIIEAARRIGELTGRRLVEEDRLLIPQTNERDGINSVVALTSAAGQMGLVIAAVSKDISGRSGRHASHATYTNVLQVITLNDAVSDAGSQDGTWIERQVQRLLGLRPDVVLIAGGLEDGADDALVRLAHIISLTALAARADTQSQQRPPTKVLFAGNSRTRERVIEALTGKAEPVIVENLRPTLEIERLEPVRRALSQIYAERVLPLLPGMPALRRLVAGPLRSTHDAVGLMTRFIAERYQRDVLSLDVGAANTTLTLSSQGRYSPVALGGVGAGYGIGAVLAVRGPAAVQRWLPFAIEEQELLHRLLNKMIRPQLLPSTREDLLIEHAVAREALGMALEALWDERAGAPYDMVVLGGGVLSNTPHPGLAALTVIDALQPTGEHSPRALDLHLDMLGLMEVCGALAFTNPDASMMLFERDLLRNTPLATCVVALGNGRPGETALEAELSVGGEVIARVSVAHGQIARLPLAPGRSAQLTLRPAPGVRIGDNAPGAVVPSEVAAIKGSALGVIIDARGRPLRLPEDTGARQQALWDWLVAVGAESGPLPYTLPVPKIIGGIPTIQLNGHATPEAPPAPAAPEPTTQVESDLAKLRQTVEEPPKRGLFGRGKKK